MNRLYHKKFAALSSKYVSAKLKKLAILVSAKNNLIIVLKQVSANNNLIIVLKQVRIQFRAGHGSFSTFPRMRSSTLLFVCVSD